MKIDLPSTCSVAACADCAAVRCRRVADNLMKVRAHRRPQAMHGRPAGRSYMMRFLAGDAADMSMRM